MLYLYQVGASEGKNKNQDLRNLGGPNQKKIKDIKLELI